MTRLRVMFVEASSGGVVGGSLTGLYHLMRGLDRDRFVSSIVLYERKTIERDLAAIGVTVHHVARHRLPKEHGLQAAAGYRRAKQVGAVAQGLRWLRQGLSFAIEEAPAALALARVIRAERPDVLHLGNGMRANFDGILAARLTGTPVVCHVKGFEKYSAREQRAARGVAALVSMTRAVQAHCVQHGVSAQQNVVIYDAVDEPGFRPTREAASVRAELGVPVDAPCLGIVGNVQQWKGQAVVVEAMARVRKDVPAARCLIVGGAHRAGAEYERTLRRRVADLGLADAITFTGFRTDVADIMNALDVVVHASIRPEPFGRVILEGMLLRKPVVATAAGGVLELIVDGETGLLVPPEDVEALANRLVPLLRDASYRDRLGTRAQAWAREHFSLSLHVAAMSEIYDHVARRPESH